VFDCKFDPFNSDPDLVSDLEFDGGRPRLQVCFDCGDDVVHEFGAHTLSLKSRFQDAGQLPCMVPGFCAQGQYYGTITDLPKNRAHASGAALADL
jgi:hypothetical protein